MASAWPRIARFGVVLLLFVIVLAQPAIAQDDEDVPYVDVPALEFTRPWIQWLFGAGFIIACMLIAFKNPHRTHLD